MTCSLPGMDRALSVTLPAQPEDGQTAPGPSLGRGDPGCGGDDRRCLRAVDDVGDGDQRGGGHAEPSGPTQIAVTAPATAAATARPIQMGIRGSPERPDSSDRAGGAMLAGAC